MATTEPEGDADNLSEARYCAAFAYRPQALPVRWSIPTLPEEKFQRPICLINCMNGYGSVVTATALL